MAAVLVQIPSLVLDYVHIDTLDGQRPELISGLEAPYVLADGATLDVVLDGVPVVVTFNAVDVVDADAVTAAEAAAILTSALGPSGGAEVLGNGILLFNAAYSVTATLEVTGGSAAAIFGFPSGVVSGSAPTAHVYAINLFPEPEEVEVPVNANIRVDLFDSDGTSPLPADITVYVNDIVAYTAGAFMSGFQGVGSSVTALDPATRRVVIDPSADFDSAALIEVHVVVGDLDETWSFIAADSTPPRLTDALGIGTSTVRVIFDEPVAVGTGPESALRPENWTLAPVSTYAVTATVVAVSAISDSVFDLATDIPLTFGATYTITAAATVEDIRGNAMAAAPNNAVSFAAYNPTIPAGRRFQLWDFIPRHNKAADSTRDLYRFIHICQEVTNLLLHEIDRFADILDPDTAPEDVIDAMLVDLGNPFDIDFNLTDKRRLLGVLVPIYQLKGTKPGIENAIQFLLGITVTVQSLTQDTWELGVHELGYDNYLGSGQQYHLYSYEIISEVVLTEEQRSRIVAIAEYMQPAHTHLIRIVEPETPDTIEIDHVELGLSELGTTFLLH